MPRFLVVLVLLAVIAAPSFSKVKRRTYHRRSSVTGSAKAVNAYVPPARSGKVPVRPTADRYKEIEQALVAKGYLQGEADGKWTSQSVDALKRFQSDQNLTADGSLTSLSLIALGLGPKRTLSAQAAPAQTGTQQ